MIEINLKIIRDVFDKVLSGEMSREQASAQAYQWMEAADYDRLLYRPETDEDKIWQCILWVLGIDLLDSPTTYLHSEEDIIDARP